MVTDTAEHPVGTSILFIQDSTTPAGYCKLQLVQDGVPQYSEAPDAEAFLHIYCGDKLQFTTDSNNNLQAILQRVISKLRVHGERHGQATTSLHFEDTVHEVVCNNTSQFKQDQKNLAGLNLRNISQIILKVNLLSFLC